MANVPFCLRSILDLATSISQWKRVDVVSLLRWCSQKQQQMGPKIIKKMQAKTAKNDQHPEVDTMIFAIFHCFLQLIVQVLQLFLLMVCSMPIQKRLKITHLADGKGSAGKDRGPMMPQGSRCGTGAWLNNSPSHGEHEAVVESLFFRLSCDLVNNFCYLKLNHIINIIVSFWY